MHARFGLACLTHLLQKCGPASHTPLYLWKKRARIRETQEPTSSLWLNTSQSDVKALLHIIWSSTQRNRHVSILTIAELGDVPPFSLFLPLHSSLIVSTSCSELAELLQALKWAHHCLADAQSQQDVELIMQLLSKEDFKNAYTIFIAVSQQMSKVIPTSPLTAQAEDLCQEVRIMIILKHQKKQHRLQALRLFFIIKS